MSFSPKYSWRSDSTLHPYMLDYLRKRNLGKTAACFADEVGLAPDTQPPIDAPQGLLYEWWTVFWDIFLAAQGQRHNSGAVLYAQTVGVKRSLAGRAPIQPPHTPVMPEPGQPGMAQGPYQLQQRQMPINGHPAVPQGSPNPAVQARMTAAQQAQYQRAMMAQAQAAAAGQPAQQPMPVNLRAGQPLPQHIQQQQLLQQHQQQQAMRPPEQSGGMVNREFLAECIHSSGYGTRDFLELTEEQRAEVAAFVRSPAGEQIRVVVERRQQQALQQQQQQQMAQNALYPASYPPPNNAYYQNTLPSPTTSAPAVFGANAQVPAPTPQPQFNAQPTAPITRRNTGRQAASAAQQQQQQMSAPPTPELSNAGPANTASPRSKKRRIDSAATQQQQQAGPSQQPNGIESYAAPARPASAASLRGQGGVASPSPRLPNNYAPAHIAMHANAASDMDDVRTQNGLIGLKGAERRRSPMAPPPVPSASSAQPNMVSTPRNDDASSQPSESPIQPNGLVSAHGQSDVGGQQIYFHPHHMMNGSGEMFSDFMGQTGSGELTFDDSENFDISHFRAPSSSQLGRSSLPAVNMDSHD